jgi:hypothetical protein
MTPMVIDVPLAELPPSPNRSKGVHWAVRSRANKTARSLCYVVASNARRTRGPNRLRRTTEARSCRIEIIYPTSRKGPMTDPDSALARMKPLIDGLVDAGCLRGDGPNDVTYEPIQQRKEGKRLIVRFTLSGSPRSPGEMK